jgi:hypothetical protein
MFVPWDGAPNIAPQPIEDACNDWTLVCHSTTKGINSFVFSRKLSTGDGQDRDVLADTYFIYAWGQVGFRSFRIAVLACFGSLNLRVMFVWILSVQLYVMIICTSGLFETIWSGYLCVSNVNSWRYHNI